MTSKQIFKADMENVEIALDALKAGEIIIYPTDTLYSFGVDASNENAIKNLNKLKNRFLPLSILLPKVRDILEHAFITELVFTKILKLLPGPYTVLLRSKKNKKISKLVQAESDLIGIRSIDIEFCNELLKDWKSPL